jgi:flagellar hook-associated protein 2
LDNSGRIVVTGGVDVSTLAVKLTRAADGSSQVLGSMESKAAFSNVIQEGQDAFYTLNGLSMQNTSNSDQNALEGATIGLHKLSGSSGPVQIDVARDDGAIKGKVNEMLDSYNSLMEMIKTNSAVTIEKTKDADGKTINTPNYGPFAGEFSVASLKSQLSTIMTSSIAALAGKTSYTSLASVGITTDAKEGTLKMDEAKFDKALSSDFDGVRRLFAASGWASDPHVTVGRWSNDTKTGTYAIDTTNDTISNVLADGTVDAASMATASRTDSLMVSRSGNSNGMMINAPTSVGTAKVTFVRGVADQINQLYRQVTDYANGSLTSASKNTQSRIDDYSKRISEQQDRVDAYRQRLVNQFTAMEKSMAKIKNQSNSFMSQIGRT